MLEKIKKRVKTTKKILDWSGIIIGVLMIIAIILSTRMDPIIQYIVMIPSGLILLIFILLMGFGNRNVVQEIEYNGDKITFISGLFHNYLFINEDLVKKKFAIVNFYNKMKVDYKGHELKVIYQVLKSNRRTVSDVFFYLDGNRII